MPLNISVNYKGVADNAKVIDIISNYDLFFLPTLGENYGHVIVESFCAGTPVLISDRTPWRNLNAHRVGWDLKLDKGENEFVKTIETMAKSEADEMQTFRQKVYEYGNKILNNSSVLESNRKLFLK
jgi:glycosyltransferase involved in cell wall biosynthesis